MFEDKSRRYFGKNYVLRIFIILFIGFVAFSLFHVAFALTAPTGVMVPFYIPPGIQWDRLVQVKLAHHSVPILAIINPQNGSGQAQDPGYVTGVQNLQLNGIVVLGYVDTNYAARNNTIVKTEITNYKNWYNVNGIFFDQMSNVQGNENYYANLTTYAKSLGITFTVGNSGVDTRPSYIGTVDNIVLYDNISLPTIQSLGGWHTNFTKDNFSILSFGINSLDQSFVNNASSYVGYMYMTNNTLPNPWSSIPDYFETLVAELDLPVTTAPSPPSGLAGATTSSSQINLIWSAPSNDGGSPVTGYMIERSTDNGTTWSIIQSNTRSIDTIFNDTGLAANTTYTYRVSAINYVGTSLPSNQASATTPIPTLLVSVLTNKPSYLQNSTALIKVLVSSGSSPTSGASVALRACAPNNSCLIKTATTNSNGIVIFQIRIPPNAPIGTYTASVIASLSGYTSGNAKTTFQVTLS